MSRRDEGEKPRRTAMSECAHGFKDWTTSNICLMCDFAAAQAKIAALEKDVKYWRDCSDKDNLKREIADTENTGLVVRAEKAEAELVQVWKELDEENTRANGFVYSLREKDNKILKLEKEPAEVRNSLEAWRSHCIAGRCQAHLAAEVRFRGEPRVLTEDEIQALACSENTCSHIPQFDCDLHHPNSVLAALARRLLTKEKP
jgi:hypothetical protein